MLQAGTVPGGAGSRRERRRGAIGHLPVRGLGPRLRLLHQRIAGDAAQAAVFPAIQAYAWTQQAAGKAKVSPDTVGNQINSVPKHAFSVWAGYDFAGGPLRGLNGTVPFAWAAGDTIDISGCYEAA